MEKAKYIGCAPDGWQHTDLFYEYRGHQYTVTKHNNGYMDKSLRQQHSEEQAKIDEMIEYEKDPIAEYSGIVEKALDLFWNYVED